MKRTMATVFGVAAIFSAIFTTAIMAADISEDVNYRGTVNFDEGAIVKIKNVQVTATAAQLNSAGGGSTATLTPTLVSNATLKVYGRDLEITNSVNLKAGSVSVASLGTGGTYPANSGSSITNIGSANIADGSLLGADIRTNTIGKANLAAADFGDFTVGADGTCTLDSGSVSSNKLAAGDLGHVSVSANGTVTIDASVVTTNMIQAGLYSGVVTNGPSGYTNILTFVNGLCTSAVLNP